MLFKLLSGIFLFAFILNSATLYSQNKIHFEIISTDKNIPKNAKVFGFYGSESYILDSFQLKENTTIYDLKGTHLYKGFYRLYFSEKYFYDFIASPGDSLTFKYNSENFKNDLLINENGDNAYLHQLKKDIHEINKTLNLISSIQSTDTFIINSSLQSILQLRLKKNETIFEYQKKFKSSVYSMLADFIKEPLDSSGYESSKIFLQNIHLSDSSSIRTNLIAQKLIDYLAFYKSSDEESFKEGILEIFKSCGSNEFTKQFCLYFYLKLFSQVGPESIFRFLVEEYYLKESCRDENWKLNKDVTTSIDQLIRLLPGNKIENCTLIDNKEKTVDLYNKLKSSENTILLFWSPECHYCEDLLVLLKKTYKKYKKKGIQIISFSISTDKKEWLDKSSDFKWINTSDMKGWESETVKKFSINKTPMLILIDSEFKILKYDFPIEDLGIK